jgi:hypothetical protein
MPPKPLFRAACFHLVIGNVLGKRERGMVAGIVGGTFRLQDRKTSYL